MWHTQSERGEYLAVWSWVSKEEWTITADNKILIQNRGKLSNLDCGVCHRIQTKLNPRKRAVAAENFSFVLKSDYVTSTLYTKYIISIPQTLIFHSTSQVHTTQFKATNMQRKSFYSFSYN